MAMSDAEVRGWIEYTCECCGCPELAERIGIKWSKRMTATAGIVGRKGYMYGPRSYEIKFSVGLFENATPAEREQTVIHEVCHACDDHLSPNGWSSSEEGHGYSWRKLMKACGLSPDRFHSISRKGLVDQYIYKCPKDCHEFKVGVRKHNNIQRGRERICRSCRGRIEWTGDVSRKV